MDNVISMTPEQLRAMADAMEGAGAGDAGGSVRHVEVGGIHVDVDMRVLGDVRTLRLVRDAQKGGERGAFAALDLFDRMLGDQREAVEKELSDEDGFCSSEAYMRFCTELFEAVGAKN